jgi:DUF2075 family protein
MIVYQANKAHFLRDVTDGTIEDIVRQRVYDTLRIRVAQSEIRSWRSSLGEMRNVLDDSDIPADAGVAIEYRIPNTSKRIDFLLTGEDADGQENAVLVELKQWEKVEMTTMDAVVATRFQHGRADTSHPSYQAWSYAALLEDYNATVRQDRIGLRPCAYLHNYKDDGVISHPFYGEHIKRAPIFLKYDKEKLRDFIKRFVKYGDKRNTLYRIDNGKIRPSKSLADALVKMVEGNKEFVMIDDQKVVYETAMRLARESGPGNKKVLIVSGGPGTGKSVVAINLLVDLTQDGTLAQYVSKNAAPRDVYASKLSGKLRKTRITNMFTGSGSFVDIRGGEFGALIVDEAHRLTERSGMFQHRGENQIMEIIRSAHFSVFFIDEDQRVTWKDAGEKKEIERWAAGQGASVTHLELASQFRCNGSDGYLAWLDNVLGIRETANIFYDSDDYDFRVVDDPNKLRDLIFERNKEANKARLVAGYCWDWVSKRDPARDDIIIPKTGFSMKWNLASDGNYWIIKPEAVNEIGCIHTSQGMDLDYVGVIVGNDLAVRDGELVTVPEARAKTDKSLSGYKKALKQDEAGAREKADRIIRNTYRTLMTRGMKGCYVYFVDPEARDYFVNHIDHKGST